MNVPAGGELAFDLMNKASIGIGGDLVVLYKLYRDLTSGKLKWTAISDEQADAIGRIINVAAVTVKDPEAFATAKTFVRSL
jgi:hypothetical protein